MEVQYSIEGQSIQMNDTYQILKSSPPLTEYFMDTTNVSYFGRIKVVSLWEATFKVTLYTLIIVVALLGNVSVVFIVWRNKRMWTTTNFYIVNLAVSDLMIVFSCQWVQLVDDLTEGWVLGAFFCRFNSFAQGKQQIISHYSSPTHSQCMNDIIVLYNSRL